MQQSINFTLETQQKNSLNKKNQKTTKSQQTKKIINLSKPKKNQKLAGVEKISTTTK